MLTDLLDSVVHWSRRLPLISILIHHTTTTLRWQEVDPQQTRLQQSQDAWFLLPACSQLSGRFKQREAQRTILSLFWIEVMPECCSVPSHASVQHKQQPVGIDTTIQHCLIINIIKQVNQQSVKYLICYVLPGTVHTVPSRHNPSCFVNRTNETWCVQYPGDFFPVMVPVSPLSPIKQWLQAHAQLTPVQGAAESYLGHKFGALSSY